MSINLFFVSSLSLVITALFLIIILIRFGKEKTQRLWLLFNFAIFVWGTGALITAGTPSDYSLSEVSYRIGCVGATFIPVFLLHMTYHLIEKRSKKFLMFSYIQAILFSAILLKTNLILSIPLNRFYGNFMVLSPGRFLYVWFLSWLLVTVYAHFYLIRFCLEHKRENLFYRKDMLFVFVFGFVTGSLNFLVPFNIPICQIGNFGIAIYCLILTYAIFKHQIFGIEIVYRKGLLYSILITIFTAIYLLLIMLVEWLFRGMLGYRSLIISLLAAFIIAILFNPLRNKIQALIDKIFLGKTPQEIANENELLHQELERSERLKAANRMALGLAHEIKNPLTTIKTFSEYLPERRKDDEFIDKFSKIIPTEVKRINNIIHRLLDFSKPSPPSFKETNITSLIKDILEFLNSEFLKRKIKIEEYYEDAKSTIKIDPAQIKQVLLNLLINAIEAMPNGGRITIRTQLLKDNYIQIEVSDTGCGIPKENLQHIFNPFFTTKDTGSGLGLSIVHQIIKNHGGTIEVESGKEKGTRFVIKLVNKYL